MTRCSRLFRRNWTSSCDGMISRVFHHVIPRCISEDWFPGIGGGVANDDYTYNRTRSQDRPTAKVKVQVPVYRYTFKNYLVAHIWAAGPLAIKWTTCFCLINGYIKTRGFVYIVMGDRELLLHKPQWSNFQMVILICVKFRSLIFILTSRTVIRTPCSLNRDQDDKCSSYLLN